MTDGVMAIWVYVLLGIPLIAFVTYLRRKKHSQKNREDKSDKGNL